MNECSLAVDASTATLANAARVPPAAPGALAQDASMRVGARCAAGSDAGRCVAAGAGAGVGAEANVLAGRTTAPASTLAFPTAAADGATLLCMLDEVDYGIVLATADGRVRFANQLALHAMAEPGPLRACEGALVAATSRDQAALRTALADASRGLRRLLHLGEGAQALPIAVKPMPTPAHLPGAAQALAMLVFGRRQACEALTLDIFASSQKLTSAEAAVLRALCAGRRPKEIAITGGVALSTVRTQINSVRVKTRTGSIRELVDRVAALPPITPAMKADARH